MTPWPVNRQIAHLNRAISWYKEELIKKHVASVEVRMKRSLDELEQKVSNLRELIKK